MGRPSPQRVARTWMRRLPPPREVCPRPRPLVSTARFEHAMAMAARAMGGTFHPATATIKMPPGFARPGDRTCPTELRVLYRQSLGPTNPSVSFDVVPNVGGGPESSTLFRSFRGDAESSKILFGRLLSWLKMIGVAVRRYVQGCAGSSFTQVLAAEEVSGARVARQWLDGLR